MRRVTLEDLRLTRSNFPTLPDNGAAYLSEQQQCQGAAQTIALDRLEAGVAGRVRHRAARMHGLDSGNRRDQPAFCDRISWLSQPWYSVGE